MRTTRKSIFTSAISLLLCFAMLLGTTFAWFTDSASSTGNVIQTGRLDAEMYWSDELLDADSDEWQDASDTAVFTYNNWEPGYTELKYIKVANAGTLNFKWKLTIEANGPVSALSDVINVYYVNPVTSEINGLQGLSDVGTLTDVMLNKTSSSGSLTPDSSVILAIAFHMDENAGNEYKGMSLCDNGFSLKLMATQDIGEFDSFGNGYDADAEWEDGVVNFSAAASVSELPMIYGALASTVTLGTSDGVGAILPAGVEIADDATEITLSVRDANGESNVTAGEGESAKSLDVHIEGIAADNTVPMIVNLGAILPPDISDTELKLYHTENGTPIQMMRVGSTDDFAVHNQYTYSSLTGEVNIYVASFSVFSAVKTSADEWDGKYDMSWYNTTDSEFTLTTAEQLAGFRVVVDGGYYNSAWTWVENTQDSFAGKTVKLGADIDLMNKPFDPIGFGYTYGDKYNGQAFMGTFDGANHTIYNLYQNCWELDPDKSAYSTYTYSTAGAGLFASVENATIKNLAMCGAEIVFECVDMGIVVGYAQGNCHFENIVITNSNIANHNRYTGGVVGEVSFGSYGTDVNLGYSHTFKNITVDSTVKISGLWGSFGGGMGGVVGGKWGDATVKMENVISAAEMDVFNDVTSAYQWYAFRGCGMLIGHTGQSSPKQATNAAADFLTCENVKVYYGDWVNYNYYEFANQDNATGRKYPWVRAEVGEYNEAFSNIRYGVPTHNGVKVSEDPNMEALKTNYTPIVFNQLYGGDQGVYGTNEHDGVTIFNALAEAKIFYIKNDKGWENLRIQHWYQNDLDTWTTNIDGILMDSMETAADGIYRVTLPAYVAGFKITADGEREVAFDFADIENGKTYNLDGKSVDVASVNGKYYETLADAIAKANGGTVKLESNVAIKETIVIDGANLTLDLNGKTISVANDARIVEFLLVKNNANVIITGNGTMLATGDGEGVEHVEVISAIDGANVTIKNGTFISDGCTAVYATRGANVFIYGGTFEAKEPYYGRYYTLDINEAVENRGDIIVYGGTYVNFDPESHTTDGKNYVNKLANSCFTSTDNSDGTYTVEDKHNFVNGKCECGALSKIEGWSLVIDVNELKAGDSIIIVANKADYALSTTQKENNRGAATITKNGEIVTINDNVQIITLEAGTVDGTFAFNVGNGYLYAASSSANQLKTQTDNNNNGVWTITIDNKGVASIVAKSSSNRNVMQYNPNNGTPLFSCYASASQGAVAIYKYNEGGIIEAHDCTRFANGATCTDNAICGICDEELENTAFGHSFDGDICSTCGKANSKSTVKETYTFTDCTAGKQYADDEEHILDGNVTVVTTECHFTSELRIYSSSTHNGYAIIKSLDTITAIGVNAGENKDTLVIYGSNDDGVTWTEAARIRVTTTSYNDYIAVIPYGYKWLKLDVEGDKQIRLKSVTLTMVGSENSGDEAVCEHTDTTTTVSATCTEAGTETVTCNDCGVTVSTEEIGALGHTTEQGTCERCGDEIGGSILTEKNYSYTFAKGEANSNGSKTLGGVTWSIDSNGTYFGSIDSTKGQQYGSEKNPTKSLEFKSESFNNVSKVVVNTSGAKGTSCTFIVKVNGQQVGAVVTLTETATSYTFELDIPVTGEIEIVYTNSAKAIYVKSITVEYAE